VKGFRFVETASADIRAGSGGDGSASFRREKFIPFGGPDGGDGGRGGHVILEADPDTDSLIAFYYQPRQAAEDGGRGRGQKRHGRNGADLVLKVPCGTEVREDGADGVLGDLVKPGDRLVVARGGAGGLGNCHWKTSTHQAPREFTRGAPGEARRIRLDLKLVADVGLVGLPNAGKSSLLAALTPARPKIAAYPFTTLNPVLGTLPHELAAPGLKLVDIPGLLPGAHAGVGLGYVFLRHVERTRALLYVLDMAAEDGRPPAESYAALREELGRYNPDLLCRPALIAGNKMDLEPAAANLADFQAATRLEVIPVSARAGTGLEALKAALRALPAGREGKPE